MMGREGGRIGIIFKSGFFVDDICVVQRAQVRQYAALPRASPSPTSATPSSITPCVNTLQCSKQLFMQIHHSRRTFIELNRYEYFMKHIYQNLIG